MYNVDSLNYYLCTIQAISPMSNSDTVTANELLLQTLQQMQTTMDSMNAKIAKMEGKVNHINKVQTQSAQVAKKFGNLLPTLTWCEDKINQLSQFKGLGWTPWGTVKVDPIKQIANAPGAPDDDDGGSERTQETEEDTDVEDAESDVEDVDDLVQRIKEENKLTIEEVI